MQCTAVVMKLCSCTSTLVSEMPYKPLAIIPQASASASASTSTSTPQGVPAGARRERMDRVNSSALFGELLGELMAALSAIMMSGDREAGARVAASQALSATLSTKRPLETVDAFLRQFSLPCSGGAPPPPPWHRGRGAGRRDSSCGLRAPSIRATPPTLVSPSWPWPARGRGLVVGGRQPASSSRMPLQPTAAEPYPMVAQRQEGGAGGVIQSQEKVQPSSVRSGQGAEEECPPPRRRLLGVGVRAEAVGNRSAHEAPPPSPPGAPSAAPGVEQGPSSLLPPPEALEPDPGAGLKRGGEDFVGWLVRLADMPGAPQAEALGLLARLGRTYPWCLCPERGEPWTACDYPGAGDGSGARDMSLRGSGGGKGRRGKEEDRVPELLLRCFASSNQNIRLHALKVLEGYLAARAESVAGRGAAGGRAGARSLEGGDGLEEQDAQQQSRGGPTEALGGTALEARWATTPTRRIADEHQTGAGAGARAGEVAR
ncbi:unnamed protein product, partial [Discosporangium mesarthrocarpum]